jgi:hypothetical protein
LAGFSPTRAGCGRPFDVAFLAISVALLGCGDDRGGGDLAAHRQKPGRCQRRLKAPKHNLDRRPAADPGPGQRFAEASDRIGLRYSIGRPEAEEAHERQRVADQVRSSDRLWLD